MNESGVLDHGLRSTHEPPSTSVGGGQRLIAPQHLTPAATAQGSERKRPAAPSGGSRSGQLRGDDMYSNSESGRPAKTMVAAPSSTLAHTRALPRATRPHHGCPLLPSAEEAQTGLVTITFVTMPSVDASSPCKRRCTSGWCSSRFGMQRHLPAACRKFRALRFNVASPYCCAISPQTSARVVLEAERD
jgi:hypothetical protein